MSEMSVTERLKKLSIRAEMLFLGVMYQEPTRMYDFDVTPSLFLKNEMGQFYFLLLQKIIKKSEYEVIDSLALDSFLGSANPKLLDLYNKYGGFKTIRDFMIIVEKDNVEQYRNDIVKLTALRKLDAIGFDLDKRWNDYLSMSYKELAETIEGMVTKTFLDSDRNQDEVVDLKYGMENMLDEILTGKKYKGLPVASNCLNSVINGLTLGDITLVAGMSGVGKTYLTINLLLPTIIRDNVPVLIMCNEEDANKWRWNILIYIANNIISKEEGFQSMYVEKSRMFDGKLSPLEVEQLKRANEWYLEKLADKIINFVSFSSFSVDKAIRLIKQYSINHSIDYFILDTFKLDNDENSKITDVAWLQLQQNIVNLYNVIKESNHNCHVWMTYQLSKTPKRYLDQSALGMSKNVADVAATLILARKVYEYEKKKDGKGTNIKVTNKRNEELTLDPKHEYMVLFIDKNRSGSTSKQVVLKTDKSRNIMKDVGFTQISEDF